jgi:hypothetical protein
MFVKLGVALRRLAALQATEPLPSGHGLGGLLRTVVERALWLLEGVEGPEAPFDSATVAGIAATRTALDLELPDFPTLAQMCVGVWTRRAASTDSPPAVRGACLGALWTSAALVGAASGAPPRDYRSDAADVMRGVPNALLGDLLAGLLALAREAVQEPSLLTLVDARLAALDEHDFLAVLPALRRAFAFFPPDERRALAKSLLARHQRTDVDTLLAPVAAPEDVAAVRALETRWLSTAARYGLLETLRHG